MFDHLLAPLRDTLRPHFNLRKTRLEAMAAIMLGLVNCRTVNLTHLAAHLPGKALYKSKYRRLRHFFNALFAKGMHFPCVIIETVIESTTNDRIREISTMDHKKYQSWVSEIDELSPPQKEQTQNLLSGVTDENASLMVIEARLNETRQCPHCKASGAVSKGMNRGLRRYLCKDCNKTFNAATGTALQGLHNKDKCLTFGNCLTEGMTVRKAAEHCDFAVSTSFRWRHRFLGTQNNNSLKLTGIVEVDETYVLESRKGERNLDRKPRKRGGKASKRGLSDEQVPILVAVDRSGTTTCSVLPSVTADNVKNVLEPRIDKDIILVTDGNNIYPLCAKSLGIKHEALNISAGERLRGAFNIQRVNNRHSRFKRFLYPFHGVSSKYLGNYVRWFERNVLLKLSARSYLVITIMGPCMRFAN